MADDSSKPSLKIKLTIPKYLVKTPSAPSGSGSSQSTSVNTFLPAASSSSTPKIKTLKVKTTSSSTPWSSNPAASAAQSASKPPKPPKVKIAKAAPVTPSADAAPPIPPKKKKAPPPAKAPLSHAERTQLEQDLRNTALTNYFAAVAKGSEETVGFPPLLDDGGLDFIWKPDFNGTQMPPPSALEAVDKRLANTLIYQPELSTSNSSAMTSPADPMAGSPMKAAGGKKKSKGGRGSGVPRPLGSGVKRPLSEILSKVIKEIKKRDDYFFFLTPVTDEIAPGYSDLILVPMDLTTIESRVENRMYDSIDDFKSDVNLVFNNCTTYNPPESFIAITAEKLQKWAVDRIESQRPLCLPDPPFQRLQRSESVRAESVDPISSWNVEEEHTMNRSASPSISNFGVGTSGQATPLTGGPSGGGVKSVRDRLLAPRPTGVASSGPLGIFDENGLIRGASTMGLYSDPDMRRAVGWFETGGRKNKSKKERQKEVTHMITRTEGDGTIDISELDTLQPKLKALLAPKFGLPTLLPTDPRVFTHPLPNFPVASRSNLAVGLTGPNFGGDELPPAFAWSRNAQRAASSYVVRFAKAATTKAAEEETAEDPDTYLTPMQHSEIGAFSLLTESSELVTKSHIQASFYRSPLPPAPSRMTDLSSDLLSTTAAPQVIATRFARKAASAEVYLRDMLYGGVQGEAYARSLERFVIEAGVGDDLVVAEYLSKEVYDQTVLGIAAQTGEYLALCPEGDETEDEEEEEEEEEEVSEPEKYGASEAADEKEGETAVVMDVDPPSNADHPAPATQQPAEEDEEAEYSFGLMDIDVHASPKNAEMEVDNSHQLGDSTQVKLEEIDASLNTVHQFAAEALPAKEEPLQEGEEAGLKYDPLSIKHAASPDKLKKLINYILRHKDDIQSQRAHLAYISQLQISLPLLIKSQDELLAPPPPMPKRKRGEDDKDDSENNKMLLLSGKEILKLAKERADREERGPKVTRGRGKLSSAAAVADTADEKEDERMKKVRLLLLSLSRHAEITQLQPLSEAELAQFIPEAARAHFRNIKSAQPPPHSTAHNLPTPARAQ